MATTGGGKWYYRVEITKSYTKREFSAEVCWILFTLRRYGFLLPIGALSLTDGQMGALQHMTGLVDDGVVAFLGLHHNETVSLSINNKSVSKTPEEYTEHVESCKH